MTMVEFNTEISSVRIVCNSLVIDILLCRQELTYKNIFWHDNIHSDRKPHIPTKTPWHSDKKPAILTKTWHSDKKPCHSDKNPVILTKRTWHSDKNPAIPTKNAAIPTKSGNVSGILTACRQLPTKTLIIPTYSDKIKTFWQNICNSIAQFWRRMAVLRGASYTMCNYLICNIV